MRIPRKQTESRHRRDGSATLVFMILLGIMLILVTAQSQALFHLHREVKLIEQQQIKRLNPASTNAPAIIRLESK